MTNIEKMMAHNRDFVENNLAESYRTTKYPSKKIAILSCMDTRLTELLPAALGFKNGEVKLIKNAGAVVSHPFGSVMRSLMVSIYELGVTDILVIGHYECGMQGLEPEKMLEKMESRGISREKIELINACGINLRQWLKGFESIEQSILQTVDAIRTHPLIPSDVAVSGFLIDPETGRLDAAADL